MGYEIRDRKLIVNEEEAATVRLIISPYLDPGIVVGVAAGPARAGNHHPKANAFLRAR